MTKVLIPFTDPALGKRAIRFVLQRRSRSDLEVQLAAIVEPRTSGKVRIFLSPPRAESFVRAAGSRWIKEAEGFLSAAGVAYRSQVFVGRPSQIVADLIRRTDADEVLIVPPKPYLIARYIETRRLRSLRPERSTLITLVH
ncbi:MAG: universal stress protein [Burkholderiales bacterium]|nr:universal stress protein [Burkholderiales bacterium]